MQEYAPNGDLFSVVETKRFDEATTRRHMAQMIAAVEYLHARSIVHRDIKPDNILLDHNYDAKLCDFGMADFQDAKVFSGRGTLPYMAPEIIECRGDLYADKAHDVWSLGVTLFVLLTGTFPWGAAQAGDPEYDAFCRAEYHRLPSWRKFSPALARFLQQRVFVPQERRCTISEMLEMFDCAWLSRTTPKPADARPTSYPTQSDKRIPSHSGVKSLTSSEESFGFDACDLDDMEMFGLAAEAV